MKKERDVACKKENIFQQVSCYFEGYKQSVQRIQWQIYRAKAQGKIVQVHALQEQLCKSFCAKLSATDHAINSIGYRDSSVESLLTSMISRKKGQDVQSRTYLESRLAVLKKPQHRKRTSRLVERYTTCTQRTRICMPLSKARYTQNHKKVKARAQVSEIWRISIAHSLWTAQISSHFNSVDSLSLPTKEWSPKNTRTHLPLLDSFAEKVGEGQDFALLEKSTKDKIREEAQYIHAFLALEPEWKAVFSQSTDRRKRKPAAFASCEQRTLSQRKESSLFEFDKNANHYQNREWCGESKACRSLPPYFDETLLGKQDIYEPNLIVKRIKACLEGSLAQCFFTTSVGECLHTIDHRVLIEKLNTFKGMEIHIEGWLKAGLLKKSVLHAQLPWGKSKRRATRLRTHHASNWRLPISPQPFPQKLSFVNSSSQKAGLPWLSNRYSLYSCFPQVLWKEQDFVHDSTQIENYGDQRGGALTALLSRVVLDHLEQEIRECANRFHTRNSQSHAPNLQHKARSLEKGDLFVYTKRQDVFCAAHLNDLIVIHHDKKLLAMCVLQVKRYLPGLALCKNGVKLGGALQNHENSCVPENQSVSDFKDDSSLEEIRHCREGFVWLGFRIVQMARKNLYVCKVSPSQDSVRDLLFLIKNRIKQSQSASTSNWVNRLNPLICQWVEYYKHCEYKRSYHKICYLIWEKTRPWLSKRKYKK